ncbi:MAG: polysaccharide biosynthesis protein GtrA [Clostridia bacterium]|nr:bifunctional glycosyltransferase family 2/GtrA family protein [Oscillospiraceae bacterium]MBS5432925.1 bifunctional glycosyltransferase family 2/GtrA family protein [Bacillota bacterium]PWM13970.1 MAG: polysaccharide biosynthesis protein GtrA [Clostridia bacterium]
MPENHSCQADLAIVLPSLNPDKKFAGVVEGLVEKGFEKIIIVDDGSDGDHKHWFDEAEAHPQCTVLHHEINRGKGRALKTAFEYILRELPHIKGVITIDGDGQHLVGDIIACGEALLRDGEKVIMGCRDFNQPGVPARSVAGNKTTSRLFRICYGIRLSDTQTGLRAIPAKYLERFCRIEGERFEYETNMLLQMKRMGIGFTEVPIETVYEDNNSCSHYNAVKDSWRIFKIMFKFLLSSAGSTVLDLAVFYLALRIFGPAMGKFAELGATAIARACSSFANFNANNAVVFGNKGHYKRALLRYYCLCIPQMLVSGLLVTLINHLFANTAPIIATLIKFVVDTCLFFISYGIQREWVFSSKD